MSNINLGEISKINVIAIVQQSLDLRRKELWDGDEISLSIEMTSRIWREAAKATKLKLLKDLLNATESAK